MLKTKIIKICILLFIAIIFQKESALASVLYLSPGSAKVGKSGTTTVQIRLNTSGEAVNAVSAYLSYPADKLDVVGVSVSGSAFNIDAENSYGGGAVRVTRGSISGVTGDVRVASVSFRGKSLGTATVSFIGGSAAPRLSDSGDSLNLGASRGATFTVVDSLPATTPIPSNLKISDIKVESVTTGSAQITWKTNEKADSILEYGIEKDKYVVTFSDNKLATEHSLKIDGPLVTAGSKIHFRVKSKNSTGEAVGQDMELQLKGYTIKVKVVDENNNNLKDVNVILYNAHGYEQTRETKNTDENGEVTFIDITSSKHLLFVKKDTFEKLEEIDVKALSTVQEFLVKLPVATTTTFPLALDSNTYIGIGLGTLLIIIIIVGLIFMKSRKGGNVKKGPTVYNPQPKLDNPPLPH